MPGRHPSGWSAFPVFQLPIQAGPALPLGNQPAVIGCPQIVLYSGSVDLGRHAAHKEYRARIFSDTFRGMSAAAAFHDLSLSLCELAEADLVMTTDSHELQQRVLMGMQILQKSVSKPDTYVDTAALEDVAAPFINVMFVSKYHKDNLLPIATEQHPLHLPELTLHIASQAISQEPLRELELKFDITRIICSFRSDPPTAAQRSDDSWLSPFAVERKGILVALLDFGMKRGLDIQLHGHGVEDCFTFFPPRYGIITFKSSDNKMAFLQTFKDQQPYFSTRWGADAPALLNETDRKLLGIQTREERQAHLAATRASTQGGRARNPNGGQDRRDRSKRAKAVHSLTDLSLT